MEAGKSFLPPQKLQPERKSNLEVYLQDVELITSLIEHLRRWNKHIAAILKEFYSERRKVLREDDTEFDLHFGEVSALAVINFWKHFEYELAQVHQFSHPQIAATITVLQAVGGEEILALTTEYEALFAELWQNWQIADDASKHMLTLEEFLLTLTDSCTEENYPLENVPEIFLPLFSALKVMWLNSFTYGTAIPELSVAEKVKVNPVEAKARFTEFVSSVAELVPMCVCAALQKIKPHTRLGYELLDPDPELKKWQAQSQHHAKTTTGPGKHVLPSASAAVEDGSQKDAAEEPFGHSDDMNHRAIILLCMEICVTWKERYLQAKEGIATCPKHDKWEFPSVESAWIAKTDHLYLWCQSLLAMKEWMHVAVEFFRKRKAIVLRKVRREMEFALETMRTRISHLPDNVYDYCHEGLWSQAKSDFLTSMQKFCQQYDCTIATLPVPVATAAPTPVAGSNAEDAAGGEETVETERSGDSSEGGQDWDADYFYHAATMSSVTSSNQ